MIEDEYVIVKTLGEGAFSKVKLGIHKQTRQKVAIKIINKIELANNYRRKEKERKERELKRQQNAAGRPKSQHANNNHPYRNGPTEAEEEKKRRMEIRKAEKDKEVKDQMPGKFARSLQKEVKLLQQLNHPGIVKLYQVIETDVDFYIVMEYVDGGEIVEYIAKKQRLCEDEAKTVFFQILSAIGTVHASGIVHRDIKLENLLIAESRRVVVSDFGLGRTFECGDVCHTFCGTPLYAAPELVSGIEYFGPPTDVWALGVVLYTMVTGTSPFSAKSMPSLYKKIKAVDYKIPSYISDNLASLFRAIFKENPADRLSVSQIARHPWMAIEKTNPYVNQLPSDLLLPPSDTNYDASSKYLSLVSIPSIMSAQVNSKNELASEYKIHYDNFQSSDLITRISTLSSNIYSLSAIYGDVRGANKKPSIATPHDNASLQINDETIEHDNENTGNFKDLLTSTFYDPTQKPHPHPHPDPDFNDLSENYKPPPITNPGTKITPALKGKPAEETGFTSKNTNQSSNRRSSASLLAELNMLKETLSRNSSGVRFISCEKDAIIYSFRDMSNSNLGFISSASTADHHSHPAAITDVAPSQMKKKDAGSHKHHHLSLDAHNYGMSKVIHGPSQFGSALARASQRITRRVSANEAPHDAQIKKALIGNHVNNTLSNHLDNSENQRDPENKDTAKKPEGKGCIEGIDKLAFNVSLSKTPSLHNMPATSDTSCPESLSSQGNADTSDHVNTSSQTKPRYFRDAALLRDQNLHSSIVLTPPPAMFRKEGDSIALFFTPNPICNEQAATSPSHHHHAANLGRKNNNSLPLSSERPAHRLFTPTLKKNQNDLSLQHNTIFATSQGNPESTDTSFRTKYPQALQKETLTATSLNPELGFNPSTANTSFDVNTNDDAQASEMMIPESQKRRLYTHYFSQDSGPVRVLNLRRHTLSGIGKIALRETQPAPNHINTTLSNKDQHSVTKQTNLPTNSSKLEHFNANPLRKSNTDLNLPHTQSTYDNYICESSTLQNISTSSTLANMISGRELTTYPVASGSPFNPMLPVCEETGDSYEDKENAPIAMVSSANKKLQPIPPTRMPHGLGLNERETMGANKGVAMHDPSLTPQKQKITLPKSPQTGLIPNFVPNQPQAQNNFTAKPYRKQRSQSHGGVMMTMISQNSYYENPLAPGTQKIIIRAPHGANEPSEDLGDGIADSGLDNISNNLAEVLGELAWLSQDNQPERRSSMVPAIQDGHESSENEVEDENEDTGLHTTTKSAFINEKGLKAHSASMSSSGDKDAIDHQDFHNKTPSLPPSANSQKSDLVNWMCRDTRAAYSSNNTPIQVLSKVQSQMTYSSKHATNSDEVRTVKKGIFNLILITARVNIFAISQEVAKILQKMHLNYICIDNFDFYIVYQSSLESVLIEIEVVKIWLLGMPAVRVKRIAGSSWLYRELYLAVHTSLEKLNREHH